VNNIGHIDLNCDLGEGMPTDAALMPYISSANIACGFHAGDEATMKRTIDLCLQHNVAIGAHPGFDDKPNFGRNNLQLSSEALYDLITRQLYLLDIFCKEAGTRLHHIKPHGALYNMAAKDARMSATIAQAVKDFNQPMIVYGLSKSFLVSEATARGLPTAHEVFADRTYQPDGSLTPRNEKNALITNTADALAQVMQMITRGTVSTAQGTTINICPETICLHGDGEHAITFAAAVHTHLIKNKMAIKPVAYEG
jgi:5-oxoprolinase (ATP-hydrolysing) subunit A